jgi:hypothetical protein
MYFLDLNEEYTYTCFGLISMKVLASCSESAAQVML